jgi:hypothetical protein
MPSKRLSRLRPYATMAESPGAVEAFTLLLSLSEVH